MSSKRGLGGGLSNLIPNVTEYSEYQKSTQKPTKMDESPSETPTTSTDLAVYSEIEIGRIAPNPKQPRTVFDEDAMAELVHSLKEVGLLQPIVVRPTDADRFEIVAGERRWRAAQLAGLVKIPAIIRQTNDDVLLRDALLENLHRAQLNPLEEAAAYQQLLADFGCTQDELSERIGRSRPQISNTIRLLRLPSSVQLKVAAGVLSAGHARALLALPDDKTMEALATRIIAEGLSVRATEEIVAVGEGGSKKQKRKRDPKEVSAEIEDIANRLSEQLETRVKIDIKRNKGSINIEFGDNQDLHRIVEMIEQASHD